MSRRTTSGAQWWRNKRLAAGLAGTVLSALALSGTALAAVSGFNPSSGTVAPGGTTTVGFVLQPPPLPLGLPGTSCVAGVVSPDQAQFAVAFDGLGLGTLPANCALGVQPVTMNVTASTSAQPGQYSVTITEVTVGGSFISQTTWPFTVTAPPTTTSTTSSTTTTSPPTTTSTTPPAPATTSPTTGTTSGGPGSGDTTPTSGPAGPEDTSDDGSAGASGPSNGGSGGGGDPGGEGGNGGSGVAVGEADASAPGREGDGAAALSGYGGIVVAEGVRDALGSTLPPPFAEAATSPLVIGELLLRSLLEVFAEYLLPLVIAAGLGVWFVWQLRKDMNRGDSRIALDNDG